MSDGLQRAPDAEAREFHESLPLALLRAREAVMVLFRPNLHAHKLTEQQWRLIRVLYENGELEFNRLAELACILRPSLTGILGRLEQAGLVLRRKKLADQRKLCIDLTDEGRRLFEAVMPEVNRIYREEIELRFSPDELRQLYWLLDKLRRVAETGAPAATDPRPAP